MTTHPGDPATIGSFAIQGRLGRGAMGAVYLARSPGGRLVAVKVIRDELAGDDGFRALTRIRVVGDIRRPWLVAWLNHEAKLPTPTRLHHGGRKLYPVAHEQSVKRRNHQLNELRAALNWYAGHLHDNRP